MPINLDKYKEPTSDEIDALCNKIIEKKKLYQSRYLRFEEWLKHNDFDKLMYRLILEHNQDYREKCYDNGYEPYPNNKLSFLIDYIRNNYNTIHLKQLECDFPNQIWFFKGYYIQRIWGQGVSTSIYNKEDLRLLLQL